MRVTVVIAIVDREPFHRSTARHKIGTMHKQVLKPPPNLLRSNNGEMRRFLSQKLLFLASLNRVQLQLMAGKGGYSYSQSVTH